MTKYIKTGTTEFEQFDGSDEMIGKYDIDPEQIGEGMPMYQLETLKGTIQIFIGDWIATGAEGEHWPIKDEIFRKSYKRLPVIPKAWGDTIEEFKANHYRLGEMFTEWDWNYDEQELIARAWLDGYEVSEVEK
ncbi:DUF1642 domain-containing protein [Paucilactobacillus suebicus]|uniref:Prophage Lp1 protein 31 n=1 Tax=Paucilactobacillus suebicus DSM 5007 = KCTC 3549 TaxID=1423807 RepID=A0A0R1VXA6_9LACO|nr:DUF1642 domain-containing protein [Paucilactobacillus suebicus]KRM10199.1 prophage Lp1 protein 31 [Paucilactobacillus suebicus DSM 5007 = KCTC 3549]